MSDTLNKIADLFGIGKSARKEEFVIITNVENSIRRSRCLSEVERFHTVESTEDGEQITECLLSWGDDPEKYGHRYGEIINNLKTDLATAQRERESYKGLYDSLLEIGGELATREAVQPEIFYQNVAANALIGELVKALEECAARLKQRSNAGSWWNDPYLYDILHDKGLVDSALTSARTFTDKHAIFERHHQPDMQTMNEPTELEMQLWLASQLPEIIHTNPDGVGSRFVWKGHGHGSDSIHWTAWPYIVSRVEEKLTDGQRGLYTNAIIEKSGGLIEGVVIIVTVPWQIRTEALTKVMQP